MNENKNKAQDATLRHSEVNRDGTIHFGCNKTCGNASLSHQEFSEQNPQGENMNEFFEDVNDTTPFCEYLIIDSKGYYCCVYRLDAPAYCTPENCPYLEGAVQ